MTRTEKLKQFASAALEVGSRVGAAALQLTAYAAVSSYRALKRFRQNQINKRTAARAQAQAGGPFSGQPLRRSRMSYVLPAVGRSLGRGVGYGSNFLPAALGAGATYYVWKENIFPGGALGIAEAAVVFTVGTITAQALLGGVRRPSSKGLIKLAVASALVIAAIPAATDLAVQEHLIPINSPLVPLAQREGKWAGLPSKWAPNVMTGSEVFMRGCITPTLPGKFYKYPSLDQSPGENGNPVGDIDLKQSYFALYADKTIVQIRLPKGGNVFARNIAWQKAAETDFCNKTEVATEPGYLKQQNQMGEDSSKANAQGKDPAAQRPRAGGRTTPLAHGPLIRA